MITISQAEDAIKIVTALQPKISPDVNADEHEMFLDWNYNGVVVEIRVEGDHTYTYNIFRASTGKHMASGRNIPVVEVGEELIQALR